METWNQPKWSIRFGQQFTVANLQVVPIEESSWDRMFAERLIPETENGLQRLIELFSAECPGLPIQEGHGHSQVSSSQLSQSAQDIAASLEAKVAADAVRLRKIEDACPNWKENIRFALRQT
jgi:hypothetical protein